MGKNYIFKLYVVNTTAVSEQAKANLGKILKEAGVKYSLEVIDVLEQPELAVTAGIAATPTLVKVAPLPEKKIIGKMEDKAKILTLLDIKL